MAKEQPESGVGDPLATVLQTVKYYADIAKKLEEDIQILRQFLQNRNEDELPLCNCVLKCIDAELKQNPDADINAIWNKCYYQQCNKCNGESLCEVEAQINLIATASNGTDTFTIPAGSKILVYAVSTIDPGFALVRYDTEGTILYGWTQVGQGNAIAQNPSGCSNFLQENPVINFADLERKVLVITILQEARDLSFEDRAIIVFTMINRLNSNPGAYGNSFEYMVIDKGQYALGAFSVEGRPDYEDRVARAIYINNAYEYWREQQPAYFASAEDFVNRFMMTNPQNNIQGATYFIHANAVSNGANNGPPLTRAESAAEIARRLNCLGQSWVEDRIKEKPNGVVIMNGSEMIVEARGITVYLNINYTPPGAPYGNNDNEVFIPDSPNCG